MIKFVNEISLEDFEAWAGGEDRLEKIKEQGLLSLVTDYINEIFYDQEATRTDINDLLWFDEYIDQLIDWS